MGVFFWLYKKENAASGDNDEYVILSPLNNGGASLVSFDEKHKKALDNIINEIDGKSWAWAVSTISSIAKDKELNIKINESI